MDTLNCDTLEAISSLTGPASWNAVVDGVGALLPLSMGMGELVVCYGGFSSLPLVPFTTIAYVEVECGGAINNPVKVPVAIRVKEEVVSTEDLEKVYEKFSLNSFFPNPFTTTTNINFSLSESAQVDLIIFDQKGQKIKSLYSAQKLGKGEYNIEWNGTNHSGNKVAPGVYICQMRVENNIQTQKVIFME